MRNFFKKMVVLSVGCLTLPLWAQPHREGVQQKLQSLSVEQKIDLLCARYPGVPQEGLAKYDWWSECLHGVARAGKATVFPKPIGMGSTWDAELIHRIGIAIGDEARAKHHQDVREHGYSDRHYGLTFFSPTLNIARDPRWGRTTECFSEDPLLTSDMGVSFIKGMQGDDPYYLKTVATAKHFVANNEENRRLGGSAIVDEVSLREYYFPAFRDAVVRGYVKSIMGAYNALNGIPCCANSMLLTDVLRKEWGFEGVVISDGSAIDKLYTHHKYVPNLEEGAALALRAGCDMSLRDEYRPGLKKAYHKGLITEHDLNVAVARVLDLRARLGLDKGTDQGNPYKNTPYSVVECERHQQLALEAAEKSMILLKNEGVLPLKPDASKRKLNFALIGDAFKSVYYGDYIGMPEYNRTLLEAFTHDAGRLANLTWMGERSQEVLIPSHLLTQTADQAYDGILGFTARYYEGTKVGKEAALTRQDLTLDFKLAEDAALKQKEVRAASWTSTLKAPQSGRYMFYLEASGRGKLFINGKQMLSKYNGHRFKTSCEVVLKEGEEYKLKVDCEELNTQMPIRLTWTPPFKGTDDTPAKLAKRSDVAILFVRDDNSSEGRDRKNLNLSDAHIELIKEVCAANPKTILLLGGGSTLALKDIIEGPAALLNVWIAGQGEAQAISNILLGKTNPSGKTAVTFCADESELPALDDYDITHGRSYQYFKGKELFPFGFGLSYTNYQYGKPKMKHRKLQQGDKVEVSTEIRNTGKYAGEEVVQCYLSSPTWQKQGLKQKLVGYQRVSLKPGQAKTVKFCIQEEQLKRWNKDKDEWGLNGNQYNLSVVPCSNQQNAVSFTYR